MAFGLFKNMFNKKIKLDAKAFDDFIVPVKLKGNQIVIDSKLKVDAGHAAVIVCKDKALDMFAEGEYELSLPLMPKATKVMNLTKGKVQRNGKKSATMVFQKKFKGDIYYVNLNPFTGQDWSSVGGIEVKSKIYGTFAYRASGTFDFKVLDAAKAVKLFLLDWAYIKPGKAINKMKFYFGESAVQALYANKTNEPDSLLNKELMSEGLLNRIRPDFLKYGIEILNLGFDGVSLPKDIAKRMGVLQEAARHSDNATLDTKQTDEAEYYAPDYQESVLQDEVNELGSQAENQQAWLNRAEQPQTKQRRAWVGSQQGSSPDMVKERIPFYDAVLNSGEQSEYSRKLEQQQHSGAGGDEFAAESARLQREFDSRLEGASHYKTLEGRPTLIEESEGFDFSSHMVKSDEPLSPFSSSVWEKANELPADEGFAPSSNKLGMIDNYVGGSVFNNKHDDATGNTNDFSNMQAQEKEPVLDIQSLINKPNKAPQPNGRRRGLNLCKGCNALLPAGTSKCPACGMENSSGGKKVCPMCGAENEANAQFCNCGCFLP